MLERGRWTLAAVLPLAVGTSACAGHAGSTIGSAPQQRDAPRAEAAAAPVAPPAPVASTVAVAPAAPTAAVAGDASAAAVFATAVKPILSRRCGQCHDPGGRMYDRIPFDNPEVVRGHRAGILRRLKEPEEKRIVEDWIGPPGP